MRGLKRLLLSAALCLGAMGLCMGNATAVAETQTSDFNCEYQAMAKTDPYVYWGSSAVNTYTAEEAAAKGIPAGYENEVLEVIGGTCCGVFVDFSAQQIPMDMVEALEFRVYVGENAANTGKYPQIRIPKPYDLGNGWAYIKNDAAIPTGEWTTVTVDSTGSHFASLGENGYLNKFELAVRSNGVVEFYVDSIDYVLKAPIINYSGGESVSIALGGKLSVPATATDAVGNPLQLQYIWEDGVELNANKTPAQAGDYTLTLKAVDSYGGVTTKELTVVVLEDYVPEASDFSCVYSANPNKLLGGYGSSAVNTYTAEEAAAKGIPEGYKNEVLEVVSIGSNVSNGILLDFSQENIPLSLVEGLEFRVYISKNDKNTGNYPQLRIPRPNADGNWVYQKDQAITTGEWTTFTIAKSSSFTYLCDEDGKLAAFELSMRSNGKVNFYIDSISYTLKADDGQAPVINYAGEDVIEVALGAKMMLDVTATDAMEGDMPVEYIWQEGTALDENGTPTQMGTYTLTLQSVDYFGHVATKTLTVIVTEKDEVAPVIDFNISEVKAKAGAKPMFTVTATDDRGKVALTYAWSDGALDNRGCLTVGTHTWTITAVDASENTTTKTVTFIVTAEEPAYSYVTDESDMIEKFTVTFDGENAQQYVSGSKVTEPATPTKEATATHTYEFIGWFNGDTQWNFNTDTLTEDINLVSKWKEVEINAPVIAFNLSEVKVKAGAKPMFTATATDDNGEVVLSYVWSDGALDNRGYLTAGTHTWTITATDIMGNKSTKVVTFIVTEEEPAYSYVTDESDMFEICSVTFDGANTKTVAYGSKVHKPADPVREATAEARYKFLGWFNGDEEWDFENDVVTEDLDLQSKWEESKRVYRVSFDGKGSNTKVTYGELIPASIIPADPTKESTMMREFIFEGWYVGDVKWNFETDVVMGDTALVAKFKTVVRTYTVTFDGENAQQYEYGSKITEPATPTKEATATHTYEFLGWFNGDRQWNFATDTVSYNTNLMAKWREIAIEVEEPDGPYESADPETPNDSNSSTDNGGADNGKPIWLSGCMSVVGGMASGLTALGMAAFVFLKKKED